MPAIAYLKIFPSPQTPPVIHELSKPIQLVGRAADCDVLLQCATISRVHCTLIERYIQKRSYHQLIDGELNRRKPSRNGLFVNGFRVEEIWECLNHNDVISFGGSSYKIYYYLINPPPPTDSSKETASNAD